MIVGKYWRNDVVLVQRWMAFTLMDGMDKLVPILLGRRDHAKIRNWILVYVGYVLYFWGRFWSILGGFCPTIFRPIVI
jgi:hypothetical protein